MGCAISYVKTANTLFRDNWFRFLELVVLVTLRTSEMLRSRVRFLLSAAQRKQILSHLRFGLPASHDALNGGVTFAGSMRLCVARGRAILRWGEL